MMVAMLTNEQFTEANDTPVIDAVEDQPASIPLNYHVTSYGADFDVEGLVKRLRRGDVLIPDWQRAYVWNIQDASRFIESLLLGLPVPGIFLAREDETNKLLVVDGQQRLKSLEFFYNGFFPPKNHPFHLKGVQKHLEGSTYEELLDSDKVKLNDSIIHATIFQQDTPEDGDTSVYHVFDRLNTGGRKLLPQEVRAAVYHGGLMDLLHEMNGIPVWRQVFGKEHTRLKDQELLLRFIALYIYSDNYTRPMEEFLNRFAARYRNPSDELKKQLFDLFNQTLSLLASAIGVKDVFKPQKSLNVAVFESMSVGLAKRLASSSAPTEQKIQSAYRQLLADSDYIESVSRSTGDEEFVARRLNKAIQAFASI